MLLKFAASLILASSFLLSGVHAAAGTSCAVSTTTAPTTTSAPPKTTTSKSTATPKPTNAGLPPLPTFPKTFKNPIKPGTGADPWVIYSKKYDTYYLIQSAGGGLKVHSSRDLTTFGQNVTKVWSTPKDMTGVWAPELDYIDNNWYIYVAIQTTKENASHRMFVLKGTSDDPQQPFKMVGKITSPDDNWAIDGTVMQYKPNGALYFIWSGWKDTKSGNEQNLYIAKMCGPTKICSDRVLLHEPKQKWQRSGSSGVNEGPEILVHGDRTFLVYSAAGSWTDNYCLALMGIDGGKDPMSPKNWWRLDDRPVMSSSDTALAPGHASFTTDRKGTPYVVYHAVDHKGAGWSGRTIRTQSFKWNKDGSPWFPQPVGFNTSLPHPA
ncbi:Arabinanase/levansucrase/invertase [Exidia glandulosa HHB12029]|uniref:Arabinanase/levansucrase/invertase n=1 Tax=Exidia glandulosa HHB12029 TaxID=1314781 RepID=A0A165CNE0_EXIGL|nr:Arabinanase/levansucrase/invertase [Exidia glandulosa HHB12029]